jgi:hypothetical protein
MSKKNILLIGLALFLMVGGPTVLAAQTAAPAAGAQTTAPVAPAADPAAQAAPAPAPAPAIPAAVQYTETDSSAAAGDKDLITDELFKAGLAYRSGDYIGALDSLWIAQEAMWRKAPLGVRNVAFITEQPENFGTYKPKAGETFKSPEPLILY